MKIPPPRAPAANTNITIPLRKPGPETFFESVEYDCTIGDTSGCVVVVTVGTAVGLETTVELGRETVFLGAVTAFIVGLTVGEVAALVGVGELDGVGLAVTVGVGEEVTVGVAVAATVGLDTGVGLSSTANTGDAKTTKHAKNTNIFWAEQNMPLW